jgi:F-type H+-transporting ATPase subunit gamma
MSQLLAIRDRIKTIRNLRKVTRAMELVTKTKINKVRQNASRAKGYQQAFASLFSSVKNFEPPTNKKEPIHYYFGFFSQKGFCGGFNDKNMASLNHKLKSAPQNKKVFLLGKRTGKWSMIKTEINHREAKEKSYQQDIEPIMSELRTTIMSGQPVEIYLAYNQLRSILQQDPVVMRIYPVDERTLLRETIFEPAGEDLYAGLLEAYLEACIEHAYWESIAGENCARLMSMKNANDNAELILELLQITYNKTRQTKITQELSEIVSAFDVLSLTSSKKNRKEE